MASCYGRRGNSHCGSQVYRCKKCGNVGCNQSEIGKCTSQGFRSGQCVKCGSYEKEALH